METQSNFSFTAPRLDALWTSVMRFPFAAAATVGFAIFLIAGNHPDFVHESLNPLANFLLASGSRLPISYGLFAAFFACLAIGLTAEAQGWPRERLWLASALAMVMMVLWVYGLGEELGTPHVLLGFALLGLCMITPHFGSAGDDELWVFNQQSFYGFGIGGIAVLVFNLGIGAVLWALSSLFGVSDGRIYFDAIAVIYAVFWPLYTLTFVPRLPVRLAAQPGYPAPLSFVLTFVALPVLLVFGTVVAIYGVQTMFLGKAPVASVSWMVMVFAAGGIALHFLLYPLRDIGGWLVRFFWRYFYWLLVPLLGLLFWAVFIRIHAYGVTENRYLAVMGGFWAAAMCLLWLVRGHYRIWYAPASLGVLLLLASFGPWGVEGVSFNSQQKRLVVLLEEVGMTRAGQLQPPADLSASWVQRRELSSLLDYFKNRRDGRFPDVLLVLRDLKNTDDSNYAGWPELVMRRWGLGYVSDYQRGREDADRPVDRSMRYQAGSMFTNRNPVQVAGYDWLLPFQAYDGSDAFKWDGVPVTVGLREGRLIVSVNGQDAGGVDVLPLISADLDEAGSYINGPVLEVRVELTAGHALFKIESIEVEQKKDAGGWRVKNVSGQLFWKP